MNLLQVLLLEDSKLDADLTIKHLAHAGLAFELTQIETQKQFVEALLERPFDLILADYALPDFDGQTALEVARKMSVDTPFIFVSGVLGEEIAINSLREGATDYVLKHRLERLGPAVKRALAERLERQARLATEAALRESEFRYKLLADNVQEYAFFMTDLQGRVTLWNKGAERIFGRREAAVLGHSVEELFLGPGDCSLAFGTKVPTLEEKEQYEGWLFRSDGSIFWASGITNVVRTANNQMQGFVTVIRDNSERKRAEEERMALLIREQAARADAEQRAADLVQANAALGRSNAELEQFAYAASHDLQEPLRMVKSFAQLLAHHCKGKLDAKSEEMLQFIERGSGRMQRLVDDLLSYSRVLHDRESNQKPIDLNISLDNALFYLRDQIETTRAVLLREPLPLVIADGDRIVLVFQNLLSNALKYRNSHPPRILVSAVRREAEWIIRVQDDGIGFDPQYSSKIFGLFKRLHRADEYAGTGVGLALCKQIVEQHGGLIWADSRLGEGATFSFSLRAANES